MLCMPRASLLGWDIAAKTQLEGNVNLDDCVLTLALESGQDKEAEATRARDERNHFRCWIHDYKRIVCGSGRERVKALIKSISVPITRSCAIRDPLRRSSCSDQAKEILKKKKEHCSSSEKTGKLIS